MRKPPPKRVAFWIVDPALSPERRAAAIRTLRDRQKIEAATACRRILEQAVAAIQLLRQQARAGDRPRPR